MKKDKIDTRKKYRISEKVRGDWGGYNGPVTTDYYGRKQYIEGAHQDPLFEDGRTTTKDQRWYTDYGTDKKAAIRDADHERRIKQLMSYGHTEQSAKKLADEEDYMVETYYRKKKSAKTKSKRKIVKKKKGCGCK